MSDFTLGVGAAVCRPREHLVLDLLATGVMRDMESSRMFVGMLADETETQPGGRAGP